MATLPSVQAQATALQPPRSALITSKLNLRDGPGVAARLIGRLEPGQVLSVDRVIDGDAFLGRSAWLGVTGQQQYFWAGAAQLDDAPAVAAPAGAVAPQVHRRPGTGTILPLSQSELSAQFGALSCLDCAPRGAVQITTAGWQTSNIVTLAHPLLAHTGVGSLKIHRLAGPHLNAVFDDIVTAGLDPSILTFDGTFVPRHKNWDPTNPDLSSHTWGVAIDINARWNPAGSTPALPGQLGDLSALVPIFCAHGFAWGGHFSHNPDGMHFELARLNP